MMTIESLSRGIQTPLCPLELTEQRLPQVQAFDRDIVARPALGPENKSTAGQRASERIVEIASLALGVMGHNARAGPAEIGPQGVVCLPEKGRERSGVDEQVGLRIEHPGQGDVAR